MVPCNVVDQHMHILSYLSSINVTSIKEELLNVTYRLCHKTYLKTIVRFFQKLVRLSFNVALTKVLPYCIMLSLAHLQTTHYITMVEFIFRLEKRLELF